MFDRLTDNAKSVLNKARQQSQRLNHEYLGTEHMLLGLLEVDGCHARVILESLRITPERVRSEIDKLIRPGPGLVTMGQLPFTPGARRVLEYSMEEAGSLGSTVLGTEHLLLGLAREIEGIASMALSACAMSLEKVRALAGEQLAPEDPAGRPGRILTGSRDHRSEAWRLRVLEEAVEALTEIQERQLAVELREVARKHGSRKWDR